MNRYLAVMAGAALGGLARYLVAQAVLPLAAGRFPWATLIVNITGCFAIGLLMSLYTSAAAVHPNWRLFCVTGVLGGFTTFSAFGWDTYDAMRSGSRLVGIANVAASVLGGYGAVVLGARIASRGG